MRVQTVHVTTFRETKDFRLDTSTLSGFFNKVSMFCIWTKGSGFSSNMAISRLDSLTVSLELLECTTGIGSTFLLFAGCKQFTAIDCVYKNHIITWIQELPKQQGHTHFKIPNIKVPYYILTPFHKEFYLKIHFSCNKRTLINLTFFCDGLYNNDQQSYSDNQELLHTLRKYMCSASFELLF